MTAEQMHIQFKMGLDKSDTLSNPNFEPEEINVWLNKAQDRFIKTRYSHDLKQETFEETQKRTDDLREVIVEETLPPSDTQEPVKPNGVLFNLPGVVDHRPYYWFAINEECQIRYRNCKDGYVYERKRVKPIQHDDYNKVIDDPFNKPTRGKIVRLMHDHYAELIGDGTYEIQTYILRYIKRPQEITAGIPTIH